MLAICRIAQHNAMQHAVRCHMEPQDNVSIWTKAFFHAI